MTASPGTHRVVGTDHLLVVQPDADLSSLLVAHLVQRGFCAVAVESGAAARDHVLRASPDLVLLDLSLPDTDGRDVCSGLRTSGFAGGIVVVTDRSGELDCVTTLDAGADDYVTKPFSTAELEARVRAVLRRTRTTGRRSRR